MYIFGKKNLEKVPAKKKTEKHSFQFFVMYGFYFH